MLIDSIINLEQELSLKKSKVLWKMRPDEGLKAHLLSWKLTKFVTISSWFGVDILCYQQIITFKKALQVFSAQHKGPFQIFRKKTPDIARL